MIVYNNKEYRNLAEQVEKNKADIEDWNSKEDTLANFGIKIIGKVASEDKLPDVSNYDYGDAFMVGENESAGYNYYISTRPTTEISEKHWQNIGKLSIVGPQGPTGASIEKIETISNEAWDFKTNSRTTNKVRVTKTDGTTIDFLVFAWAQKGEKGADGAQGIQGEKGDKGDKGDTGEQGPKGEMGPTAPAYHIVATVTSTSQLPDPTLLKDLSAAYIVETDSAKKLYIQTGLTIDVAKWEYLGDLSIANYWELSNNILSPVEAVNTVQVNNLAVLNAGGLACSSPTISGVATCSAIDSPATLNLSGTSGVNVAVNGTNMIKVDNSNVSFDKLIVKDNKIQYKYSAGTKGLLSTDDSQTLLQSQGDLKLTSYGTNKTSGLTLTSNKSKLFSPSLILSNTRDGDGDINLKILNDQIQFDSYLNVNQTFTNEHLECNFGQIADGYGFSFEIGAMTLLGYKHPYDTATTGTLNLGSLSYDTGKYLTNINIGSAYMSPLTVKTYGTEISQLISDGDTTTNVGTKLYSHDGAGTYLIKLPYMKCNIDGKMDDTYSKEYNSQLHAVFSNSTLTPEAYDSDGLDLQINPEGCSIQINSEYAFDVQKDGIYANKEINIETSSDVKFKTMYRINDSTYYGEYTVDYITRYETNVTADRITELLGMLNHAVSTTGRINNLNIIGNVKIKIGGTTASGVRQCNVECVDQKWLFKGYKYADNSFNIMLASGYIVSCTEVTETTNVSYLVPVNIES